MVRKKPTVTTTTPLQKATEMKLAGVGTFLSSLPVIGKPIKAFGTGVQKGITSMMNVSKIRIENIMYHFLEIQISRKI